MSFENFEPMATGPSDRLECGVCWSVYDPSEGDPVWQIPPGTPFSQLPQDWRCPHCDAPRARFIRVGDER